MEEEYLSKESKNYIDEKGNVYILGEFDDTISTKVIPGLIDTISRFSTLKDPPILTFYIDSPGGYNHNLYTLLSLINKAKEQGITVVTVVLGYAYSCASMLAICGDHRIMWEYGEHLMHYGKSPSEVTTPLQSIRNAKHCNNHFNNIEALYRKHTKLKSSQIKEFLKDDNKYLTADDCLEYGLVDEVIKDIPYDFNSKKN